MAFTDILGKESEEFKGVTDALALTKGVGLVGFKNGRYTLINSQLGKTQTPISNIYGSIKLLDFENFTSKLGNIINIKKNKLW